MNKLNEQRDTNNDGLGGVCGCILIMFLLFIVGML
jgi:hypothetical protein